jgi:hypothetical protein
MEFHALRRGSPWQTLNLALGQGVEKIKCHWRDFRLLWDNFEVKARAVMDICGTVAIEWPERCKYWTEPQVAKYNFVQGIFHGCAYGLVTEHNLPLGQAMKKPWRCSSNDPVLLSYLNDKCQGGHEHAECRGRDCKASDDYTPAVVDAIHAGLRLCCGPSDEDIVEGGAANLLHTDERIMTCVEHLYGSAGGPASSFVPPNRCMFVSHQSSITHSVDRRVGFSRAFSTPLSDLTIHKYDPTAGITKSVPSPLLSCGFLSDIRSCNNEDDSIASNSLTTPMDNREDNDHEGKSGDLSCVYECSASDDGQDTDEFRDCIEGDSTDEEDHAQGTDTWICSTSTDARLGCSSISCDNDDAPCNSSRAIDDDPPGVYRVHGSDSLTRTTV